MPRATRLATNASSRSRRTSGARDTPKTRTRRNGAGGACACHAPPDGSVLDAQPMAARVIEHTAATRTARPGWQIIDAMLLPARAAIYGEFNFRRRPVFI